MLQQGEHTFTIASPLSQPFSKFKFQIEICKYDFLLMSKRINYRYR